MGRAAYGRNMTAEFDCRSTFDEQSTLRLVYDSINQGKPVILYVNATSGNEHWVTVVGYENADATKLRPENFIVLDSNFAFALEPVSSRPTATRCATAIRSATCASRKQA